MPLNIVSVADAVATKVEVGGFYQHPDVQQVLLLCKTTLTFGHYHLMCLTTGAPELSGDKDTIASYINTFGLRRVQSTITIKPDVT